MNWIEAVTNEEILKIGSRIEEARMEKLDENTNRMDQSCNQTFVTTEINY